MKTINKIIIGIIFCLVLCGCNNINNESLKIEDLQELTEPQFYTNKFGEDKIPNQWSAYGVGDPFVYRFNGRYYLYASTKNYEEGVRGWVSDDLINYEPITGEGLETGYVSNDPCTLGAYAPEVIYLNGYFYMLQSQSGNGHYILRSEKPEGPFVKIVDNFGESIDGSFFIDDDEQLYMLRASNTGIRIIKLNDDLSIGKSRTLDNTVLGGWTEGPFLLKRDNIYYLTYTGNNVTSEGYRIGYSYSNDELFARDAFHEGGTIALSTDENFKGLGHSSTVLGPDLDSYYLAYHNLNSSGGPDRSYNISRLSFSGSDMIVENAELNNNIIPNMPTFSGKDDTAFRSVKGKLLSQEATQKTFSVEYNFIGNNSSMIFGYVDDNNYYYVNINNDVLTLNEVKNGKDLGVSSVRLIKNYDYSKLHTIRVAYKDRKLSIYFDNLNKICLEDKLINSGCIGYVQSSNLKVFYTAFSNVAHGSSDNEVIHQNQVLATSYTAKSFDKSEIVINKCEEETDLYNMKINSYDLHLKSKGDKAFYKIYVSENGYYGFDMTLLKENAGKKVMLQVDNETPVMMTIPKIGEIYGEYYKTRIGELTLKKGVHYLIITCEGELRFHDFSYYLSSPYNPVFENDLKDYVLTGSRYVTTWKLRDNGHYALSGNRNVLYFGKDTLTDYTIEVDIELVGDTQASTCGILVRGANPSFSNYDNASSVQGYYIGFNNSKVFISKCNYNNSETDVSANAYSSKSFVLHHLKVVVKGNNITLDFDNGAVTLNYIDAIGFTHGSLGFYTDGAASIYRNLKIYKA